ncbi:MAG TPA: uroporphyrinogen-III synthase [Candidatus Acidoferrales bacterium]
MGKCIVATRAPEQAGELVRELNARGAEVLLFPMVRFSPLEDWGPLDQVLLRLNEFGVVIFLSANAVRHVFERCRDLDVKFGAGEGARPFVAAIGPTTERALIEAGLRADYVGRDRTGESLVRELGPRIAKSSVLLPRSDRGNEAIVLALREMGAQVTEVVAYRTTLPDNIDQAVVERIRRGVADVVMFASPSAVQNFVATIGAEDVAKIAKRVHFAAIGPTTARSLRDVDLPVAIEAVESSAHGLAESIERFYAKKRQS